MAVLLDSTGRRGEHDGHRYGERQRRTRSVVLRERAEEGEGVQGESEGVERECVARGAGSRSGGSRRWHGAWPACTAATRLSSYWREVGDDWQRRWAGPARWAGQLGCDR